MTITDNGTWVYIIAGTGKDLISADGLRAKSVSCPKTQQSAWSEVSELVDVATYEATEPTETERLFLQSLRFDFRATAEFINRLLSDGKITNVQYDKIKTKLTTRKEAIDYYIINRSSMTKAQLQQCTDKIIG